MNEPRIASPLVLATLLVFGCASTEEKEKALFDASRTACEKYGFKPSTDSFAQCIQTEINNIKNREAIAAQSQRTSRPIDYSTSTKSEGEPIRSSIPSSNTTNCARTLLGVRCTTD